MQTVKKKVPIEAKSHRFKFRFLYFSVGIFLGAILITVGSYLYFEYRYNDLIYPGIYVGDLDATGKSKKQVEDYFERKSSPFLDMNITLTYEDTLATLSAKELELEYDKKLSAEQAYLLGRSGNFLSDISQKLYAIKNGTRLPVVLHKDETVLRDFLENLSLRINIEPVEALFNFEGGKVKAFRLSKPGQKVDTEKTVFLINEYLQNLITSDQIASENIVLPLPVDVIEPQVSTEESNGLGIRELIGVGRSKFAHSIPGRIYNVSLAASRINGRLIPPGATFSFNEALGDVSASTGFQPAYIIKDGKTVLGDGGGVCQVSTTLFRAALNAGLPIVERWAHAYRVGYYEQDSKPGFDATVYAPGVDLKIKNDTVNNILIQAITDKVNASLTFEFYGTSDGRTVDISAPKIYSESPPPPDLYQDDPTLSNGEVKQTDFAAWGAKAEFNYKVIKNDETVFEKRFFSNYRPWQAVFLRGTKT